jgi:RNA polymerase sigma-70 factor (ECF subfamily)
VSPDDVHQVLTTNGGRLLGFFANRVDSPDDAADLVGDVFLVAWRRVRQVPVDPDEARMWLFGVARKVLANHRRGRNRRDVLDARIREQIAAAIEPDDTYRVEVREAVRALPDQLAEVVRLVHWDGFSLEETGRLLGIPASTARSRHARARELLRAALTVKQ